MRRHETDDAINELPLFAGCDRRGIEAVRRVSDEVFVRQGQVVHPAGVGLHWAYVVMAGHLQVGSGPEARIVRPGEVFGADELLDSVSHVGEVRALSAARVLVIGQRELFVLMDEVAGFAAAITGELPAVDLRDAVSRRRGSGRTAPGWDRRPNLGAARAASRA